MSIVINQTPALYSPSFNELNFVVTSSNSSQDNFKYVCDIYVNGSVGYTFRIAQSADPDTGKCRFDISNFLRSYTTSNPDNTKGDDGFETCGNSIVRYTCKFGEEYGLLSSGVTVYPSMTNDSERYAWNSVFDAYDFKNFQYTLYAGGTGNGLRALTNQPTTLIVRSDEYRWMYGLVAESSGITGATVRTFNSSGSGIQTVSVINNFKTISAGQPERYLLRFPAGVNLNNIAPADITAGSQPIITSSVAKYTINWVSTLATSGTTTYTFNINDECSQYTKYTLHFKNELGGFDTFSFILVSRRTVQIERSRMKRIVGSISGSSYSYNKYDRPNIDYNTRLQDEYVIESTFTTEDVQQWLRELFESPEVFHDDDTHGLLAINIMDTQYIERKHANEKLINVRVTFRYAFDRYRQNG